MPAGPYVIRNGMVAVDGVNISPFIREVSVELTADDVDVTAMGAGGHGHLAGIRQDSFTFTAYSDTATLDTVFATKFASGGTFEVKVTASGSTIGTSNPMFIGYCPALTYNPISGAVGDAAMTPVNMPANGTITRLTAGTIP